MAKQAWYWLAAGLGPGAVNVSELLEAYPGGPAAIAADLGSSRLDELLTQKQAQRLAATRFEDFEMPIAQALSQGIVTLAYDEPAYPAALKTIHNPPSVLFVQGDVALLNGQLAVGMVGARRPSAYGVEAARAIGRGVALGGAIIVSGLAAGLDAEAHKAALAVNGPTIACIAFGHSHCYPAANKTLMEVIARTGAVVSEYPLGTGPEKAFFLQRNRLIAGLSHGLVVVEARRYSGTMSTVNFAVDFGREVFAVPGSIFSELSGGTNEMIREGAYVAASARDVLEVYGVSAREGAEVLAQAEQGRPQSAETAPPRQQPIGFVKRPPQPVETGDAPQELAAGQQSFGELLRSQAGAGSGPVSAEQAIAAFRSLQQQMPPATDDEQEARSRALEAQLASVVDKVELSTQASPPPKPKGKAKSVITGEGKQVMPFTWGGAERLSKKDVEDLSAAQKPPAKAKGGRVAVPSRVVATAPRAGNGPIAPVREVALVSPVADVTMATAVAGVAAEPLARQAEPRATQAQSTPPPPVPAADRPVEKPQMDNALTSRLRTLQPAGSGKPAMAGLGTPAQQPSGAAQANQVLQPLAAAAPEKLPPLSGNAKLALKQLGINPVPLADICQRSGLSSAQAMAALTELELAGLSRQLAGRRFALMQ